MDILSKGYRFRRGTGSPFDYVPAPGVDLGLSNGVPCQWCAHCQMSVETRTETHNQAQVFGMKQWCRRCGNVTTSAIYYHVQSLEEPEVPLLEKAREWAREAEEPDGV